MTDCLEPRHPAVQKLENLTGYTFNVPELALQALTVPGVYNYSSPTEHYRVFEFLGDRVLNLCVAMDVTSDPLIARTGTMFKRYGLLHSNMVMAQVAAHLDLRSLLQGSPTEILELLQYRDGKLLADVLEAVFGAIFADSGYDIMTVYMLYLRLVVPLTRKMVRHQLAQRQLCYVQAPPFGKLPPRHLLGTTYEERLKNLALDHAASLHFDGPGNDDSEPARRWVQIYWNESLTYRCESPTHGQALLREMAAWGLWYHLTTRMGLQPTLETTAEPPPMLPAAVAMLLETPVTMEEAPP